MWDTATPLEQNRLSCKVCGCVRVHLLPSSEKRTVIFAIFTMLFIPVRLNCRFSSIRHLRKGPHAFLVSEGSSQGYHPKSTSAYVGLVENRSFLSSERSRTATRGCLLSGWNAIQPRLTAAPSWLTRRHEARSYGSVLQVIVFCYSVFVVAVCCCCLCPFFFFFFEWGGENVMQ